MHRSLIEWVATAFMVAQASLLLVAGRLGDRHGRKKFFMVGLAVFSGGSLCTALAPTLPLIIAARVVTGAGAAFLTAGTLAIVLPMFPPSKAGEVIGYWGAVGSVAGWLTPLLGPFLVQHSWRWAFATIVPLGLCVIVVGLRVLPEQRATLPPGRTDTVSLIAGPPALGLLMLLLSNGRVWGWTSTPTVLIAIAATGFMATLVYRSLHAERPLLDLDLVRVKGYSGNLLTGVCQQAGFFAFFITGPLIMTNVWHWSVGKVGLAIAVSQMPSSIGSPVGGRLVKRFGYRDLEIAGALLAAGGVSWMVLTAGPTADVWSGYVPGALLFGFGCSLCGTLSSGAALASLSPDVLGIGNSLQQLIRRMGGAIGVAIAYVLLGDAKGPALLAGGRRVWWMVVVVHLLALVPLVALTDRSRRGGQHA
jgi:EmrB/QacA subfamily drug resistance transporter